MERVFYARQAVPEVDGDEVEEGDGAARRRERDPLYGAGGVAGRHGSARDEEVEVGHHVEQAHKRARRAFAFGAAQEQQVVADALYHPVRGGGPGGHAHRFAAAQRLPIYLVLGFHGLRVRAALPRYLHQSLRIGAVLAAHHDHRVHRAGYALRLLLPLVGRGADGLLHGDNASGEALPQLIGYEAEQLRAEGGLGYEADLVERRQLADVVRRLDEVPAVAGVAKKPDHLRVTLVAGYDDLVAVLAVARYHVVHGLDLGACAVHDVVPRALVALHDVRRHPVRPYQERGGGARRVALVERVDAALPQHIGGLFVVDQRPERPSRAGLVVGEFERPVDRPLYAHAEAGGLRYYYLHIIEYNK